MNIYSAPGIVTIGEEKKVCTTSESFIKMCDSNEVNKSDNIFGKSVIYVIAGSKLCVFSSYSLCSNSSYGDEIKTQWKIQSASTFPSLLLHTKFSQCNFSSYLFSKYTCILFFQEFHCHIFLLRCF